MRDASELLRSATPWSVLDHLRGQLGELFTRLGAHLAARPPTSAALLGADPVPLCAVLSQDLQHGSPAPPRAGEPAAAHLPVPHALRAFACGPVERDALLLAVACELDVRAARVIGMVSAKAAKQRAAKAAAFAGDGDPPKPRKPKTSSKPRGPKAAATPRPEPNE